MTLQHATTQYSISQLTATHKTAASLRPPLLSMHQVNLLKSQRACVAVCCGMLWCVAECCRVCCNVLQCCSVLQSGSPIYNDLCSCVLYSVEACCTVLQRVAECCRVLQCFTLCCSCLYSTPMRMNQDSLKNVC